jgi:acetate kinase
MQALVFNCGSSSLKFELVELDSSLKNRRTIARGKVEEIGRRSTHTFAEPGGLKTSGARPLADHRTAATFALSWLSARKPDLARSLDVVAHRIVHGGEELTGARLVDRRVIESLERASQFAPLHNPPALSVMRAMQSELPGVPAVVLADTAFHHTLAPEARRYALPWALAERYGIRRFGFHGIGHAWMAERAAELVGKSLDRLNLVTMHLGAGCSAAAIRGGRSVDTSMGLTPLEGLVMGTRSGDLDPAIVTYLAAREKIAPAEIERILNHESGLLGVSGISDDLRELTRAAQKHPNGRAVLALGMFCHRARKYLGAYLAVAGPCDAIAFGGGIGENADHIRKRICAGLEWLGLAIDPRRNRAANGCERRISADGSRIAAYVIPLDEELYIARAALRLVAPRRVARRRGKTRSRRRL